MTLVVVPCRIVGLDSPLRCARVAGHRLRMPCRRAVADGVRGSSWWPLDHRLGHMNPWRRLTDHSLRLVVVLNNVVDSLPCHCRGRYTRIQWTSCLYYEGGCHGAMRWISSMQVAACFIHPSLSALMSCPCGNSVFVERSKKKGSFETSFHHEFLVFKKWRESSQYGGRVSLSGLRRIHADLRFLPRSDDASIT